MPRSGQVVRQWRIWQLLAASPSPFTAEEIAEHLRPERVPSRTIRRDLEALREAGAAIVTERRGRQVRHGVTDDGPPLRVDPDTLVALRLALGALRPFAKTAIGANLEQLARQLERRVPARLAAHFAALANEVVVRNASAPSYAESAGVLASLQEAIAEGKTLEIDYRPLRGRASRRDVHPQAVVYGPRGLYLLALDGTRALALRTFRMERITRASVGVASGRRSAFDPEDHLRGSIGVFSPEHAPRRFRIRLFSEVVARMLGENPWHPSQKIRRGRRGEIEMSLELTSSRELVSRVVALGGEAEVIEPLVFREEVAATLRAAARHYRASHGSDRRSQTERMGPRSKTAEGRNYS